MSLVDEVKARLDIVEVVSSYVPLQRSGRNFKALCPFHAERTPSFFVFPERQTWRCFGACATGGDVLSFVMRMERLDFAAALRLLAQRAGIPLREREAAGPTDPLLRAVEEAERFYHRHLLTSAEGEPARAYLERRGVRRETVEAFRLGLAPRDRTALKGYLLGMGFAEETLVQAGLLHRGADGETRDNFPGRLMFPIHDPRGRPVGFGARSLDGSEPKYINTPRTPLFDKGRLLYALHRAGPAIRQQGTAVVVEGYMDALMAHQAGYTHVVAQMGTALTEHQVALLRPLARTVVLALDPDPAGLEATLRNFEAYGPAGLTRLVEVPSPEGEKRVRRFYEPMALPDLRVALLPEGWDPADALLHDPSAWESALAHTVPLIDYVMDAYARRFDLSSPEGKAQLAERLSPLIFALRNPYEQDRAFQRLADLLGVDRGTLLAALGRPQARPGRRARATPVSPAPFRRVQGDPLEAHTLALLLQDPNLLPLAESLSPSWFRSEEHREIFLALRHCDTMESLKAHLPDALQEHFERLRTMELPPADARQRQRALLDCIRRLEERHLRERKALEAEALAGEGGADIPVDLEVGERLRALFDARTGVPARKARGEGLRG